MSEALQMNFPGADLEIEIVLSIMFRGSLLDGGFRRIRILLRMSAKGIEDKNQAARHEISPNVFAAQSVHVKISPYLRR